MTHGSNDDILVDTRGTSSMTANPIVSRNDVKPSCTERITRAINPFQCWFPTSPHSSGIHISSNWPTLLWKTITAIGVVASFGYCISAQIAPVFYFAYFTTWAATWTCFYFVLSFLSSWVQFFRDDDAFLQATWKPMWLSMELATHSGFASAFGTWGAVALAGGWDNYNRGGSITYGDIVWHGPIFVLCFIDGVFVNKIGYQWSHWTGFLLPLDILYILWTVVHAFCVGNNPLIPPNDDALNDDSIYPHVIWKDNWRFSLMNSVIAVFGVGACDFGVLNFSAKRFRSLVVSRRLGGTTETGKSQRAPEELLGGSSVLIDSHEGPEIVSPEESAS